MPWRQRWGSGSLGLGSEVLDGKSLHFQRVLWASGEGHGNPLQGSCLENPTDSGAWQAVVHRVAKSRP